MNIGVAAHITAATAEGPRFDSGLTADERKDIPNGVWLCQGCAKLVDNDPQRYSVDVLLRWKTISETAALRALENRSPDDDDELLFLRLEQIMPDLLDEIRADLKARPLSREFVILKKAWSYNSRGHELAYYYEDHAELENKLRILQNYGLIQSIKFNEVLRFTFTESFARYCGA